MRFEGVLALLELHRTPEHLRPLIIEPLSRLSIAAAAGRILTLDSPHSLSEHAIDEMRSAAHRRLSGITATYRHDLSSNHWASDDVVRMTQTIKVTDHACVTLFKAIHRDLPRIFPQEGDAQLVWPSLTCLTVLVIAGEEGKARGLSEWLLRMLTGAQTAPSN